MLTEYPAKVAKSIVILTLQDKMDNKRVRTGMTQIQTLFRNSQPLNQGQSSSQVFSMRLQLWYLRRSQKKLESLAQTSKYTTSCLSVTSMEILGKSRDSLISQSFAIKCSKMTQRAGREILDYALMP
jgi:hypothetical protein